jgi:hypothetical protein
VNTADLAQLRHALVQNCGLEPARAIPANREGLIEELARRVDYLLRHDAEKLMYYLYRLDVPESEFAGAIAPGSGGRPARAIAEAILTREAQRLETYKRFTRPDHDQLEFND